MDPSWEICGKSGDIADGTVQVTGATVSPEVWQRKKTAEKWWFEYYTPED